MAQWKKINARGNVQDRRAKRNTARGIGITGLLLMMGVTYMLGGNPLDVLQDVDPSSLIQQEQSQEDISVFEGNDEYENFVSTILGSNNMFWNSQLKKKLGKIYTEPTLVLFRGSTASACGGAQSVSGPHYCPVDNTIYLDERFFEQLKSRYGARGGDVAEAYVIAHEVGHHIQNELNTLGRKRDPISIELQADCYAGMWAGSLRGEGIFEEGEIDEALDAAAAVGDDNIQKRTTGHVHPESWTHGSSAQRKEAFNLGYERVSFDSCQRYN